MKNGKWSIQKLVLTGMLAAVAGVLMSLDFSVPMMPAFYKVDFSDVPSILATFLLGPVSGAAVEVIKIVIKMILKSTTTFGVGELANLIGIVIFIAPMYGIYCLRGKTGRAALEAAVISVPVRIAFSCCVNAFITLPLYAAAMGISLDQVVQIVGKVNPAIHDLKSFIILATIPFNLIKNSLNHVIGYLLFVRLKEAKVISSLALGRQ